MLALFPTQSSFLTLEVWKMRERVRAFHMHTGRALETIYIYLLYTSILDVAICTNVPLFLQLADNASSITCGRWDSQANGLSRLVTCSVKTILIYEFLCMKWCGWM